MQVTNRIVTTDTTGARVFCLGVRAFDSVDNVLMTFATGFFRYFSTARRDVNVVVKPAGREIVGMPEPVARFSCVLADESRRRMTIVADSNGAMARLHPTIELVLHDVTVRACFGIVRQVRISTCVDKGVRADADGRADCNTQDHSARKPCLHLATASDDTRHIETSRCRLN